MMLAELELESHQPLPKRLVENVQHWFFPPQAQYEAMVREVDRISDLWGTLESKNQWNEQQFLCERSDWAPGTIFQVTAKLRRIIGNNDLAAAIWATDPRAVPEEFRPADGNIHSLRTFGLRWINDGSHRADLNATLDAEQVPPNVAVAATLDRLNRHIEMTHTPSRLPGNELPKTGKLYHRGKPTTGRLNLRDINFEPTDRENVFLVKIEHTQVAIELSLHHNKKNRTKTLSPDMTHGHYDLSVVVSDTEDHAFARQEEEIIGAIEAAQNKRKPAAPESTAPATAPATDAGPAPGYAEHLEAVIRMKELTEWKKRFQHAELMKLLENGDPNAVSGVAETTVRLSEHTPQEIADLFVKELGHDFVQIETPEALEKKNVTTVVFARNHGGYSLTLEWDSDDNWFTIRVNPTNTLQETRRAYVLQTLRRVFDAQLYRNLKGTSAKNPYVWRNPRDTDDCYGLHMSRNVNGKYREFTDTDVHVVAVERFRPPLAVLRAAGQYEDGSPLSDKFYGTDLVIPGKKPKTVTVTWKLEPGTDAAGRRRAKIVCYLQQVHIPQKKTTQ